MSGRKLNATRGLHLKERSPDASLIPFGVALDMLNRRSPVPDAVARVRLAGVPYDLHRHEDGRPGFRCVPVVTRRLAAEVQRAVDAFNALPEHVQAAAYEALTPEGRLAVDDDRAARRG